MRQQLRWTGLLTALILSVCVASCDPLEGDDDGGKTDPDSGPPPSGIFLKKAGETATADFSSGSEQYLVVPYSVSTTPATGISFDIKITTGGASADSGSAGGDGSTASNSYKLNVRKRLPLSLRNPALWLKWQNRLATERWKRGLAEKAAKMKLATPPGGETRPTHACTLSSECQATEVCAGGTCSSTVTIKVEEFATSSTTVDVEVKKKGKVGAVLVDKGDTVTSADVDDILDKFEKVIHPRDVALFGDPALKSSGTRTASDRNGDGLVWIVLTSKVAERTPASVGFFLATDFTDDAKSNKADLLYIDSAQTGEKAHTTIAHEFQHLLSYGVKVYKPKVAGGSGTLEDLWLDEGLSHFAEDACGFGRENVTLLDQEVFTSFADKAMFEKVNDGLVMRGLAFLYLRYLFEQKGGVTYGSSGGITDGGGAAFLQKVMASTKRGTGAVTDAYGDYKAAFGDWIAAVSVDGRGLTYTKKYGYGDLVTDPITSNKIGVKIRGTRKDESGTPVTLEGPIEDDLTGDTSDAIPNATGKFFLLKGQTGKVDIIVTSKDSDFNFAVIKIK